MNDETNISKRYVYFTFNWQWIKDKQIIHRGNQYGGMLSVIDDEGYPVKIYGYELISKDDEEQQ